MSAALMKPVALQRLTSASRPAAQQRCLRLAVSATRKQQTSSPVESAAASIRNVKLPAVIKPAATAAVANLLMALPAAAEPGKIFDFNLTLPVMITEFLLLMVFLDKTWFSPVGKLLSDRDEDLRKKLASVRDDSGELKSLQEEAERIVSEARKSAQAVIAEAKESTQAEQNKKLADVKAKIDKELAQALETLEQERKTALSDLDEQVSKLSQEIMERVLPEGVQLS